MSTSTAPPIASLHHQDPAAWSDDLAEWALDRCTHREQFDDWSGLSALYRDFAKWSVDHGRVPCTRLTLEALLRDEGFLIHDGMVQGVVLTEDLWAITQR